MNHNPRITIALSAIAAATTATVARAVPELDCSNFWVDPNTQRSQCLEFEPRTPPPPPPGNDAATPLPPPPTDLPDAAAEEDASATASSEPESNSSDEPTTADVEGRATPEWMEIAQRPDGLKLLWDKNSLELGSENARTFWYRQDASDVKQTEQYPYLTQDTKITVSCTIKTFDFDDIKQVGRSGETRSFRSTFDGVVSEGTPLETVVDAVCAADPDASKPKEEPDSSPEAIESETLPESAPDASPSQE